MTNKPTKRKTMVQAEKIEFALKHKHTCAICGRDGLMTKLEANALAITTGVYKVVETPMGKCKVQISYKGDKGYDDVFDRVYHIDHKIPLAKGGSNLEENLHLLCAGCNLSKGSLTVEDYLQKLAFLSDADDIHEKVADALDVDVSTLEYLVKGKDPLQVYPFLQKIVEAVAA